MARAIVLQRTKSLFLLLAGPSSSSHRWSALGLEHVLRRAVILPAVIIV